MLQGRCQFLRKRIKNQPDLINDPDFIREWINLTLVLGVKLPDTITVGSTKFWILRQPNVGKGRNKRKDAGKPRGPRGLSYMEQVFPGRKYTDLTKEELVHYRKAIRHLKKQNNK